MKCDPIPMVVDGREWFRALRVVAVLALAGCASAGTSPAAYRVETHTDAPPPISPPPVAGAIEAPRVVSDGPPSLSPAVPAIVGLPSTRISVSGDGRDISDVITSMARQAGLTPVIDPAVHGPINNLNLQGVPLTDAMRTLVGSQYQFRAQNGQLIVGPIQLVQQTYDISYLQMSRSSAASTVVARNLQSASNTGIVTNGSGGGTGVSSTAGGLVGAGTDVITSSSNADVWGELTIALKTMLFGGGRDSSRAGAGSSATNSFGGASASSTCDATGTCLNVSPFASIVTVTATPDKQQQVADWLNLYKAAINRQVYIRAKVVEVSLDNSKSYGIDWTAILSTAKGSISFSTDPASTVSSTGNSAFNLGLGDVSLKAVLTALEATGNVSVLANPSTTAMTNQKASFDVTREILFPSTARTPIISPTTGAITGYNESTNIQTAQVGIIFDVLAGISSDNIVQMAIRPSVTSLVSTQTFSSSSGVQAVLPTTDRRQTDTMARVRSGETVMIGGLIQTQTTNDRHGIPILMNLPGIGRLFSHTSVTQHHSELVIFVTPEIVSGQAPGGH